MFTTSRKRSTAKVLQPFPPEIDSRMIDELSLWDDKSTIVACALVSPSFRYLSQKRLFEDITLSTQHRNDTNTLYSLLYKNPDISLHIRRLSLFCNPESEGGHDGDFGGLPGDLLPDVLMKLLNLVSLNFTGDSYDIDSWACLTPDTQQALIRLGRCAQVTTIDFNEIRRWPVSFLRHFSPLKNIRIRTNWDPFIGDIILDESTETGPVGSRFKLEELQIKFFPSPTLFSCIEASHPALRTLAFYSDNPVCTATLEELIRSSTKSLERLTVLHDREADTEAELSGDALGGLTNLRRISVKGYNLDTCKSLVALLKNTAGACPIEKISIRLCGIDTFSPRSDAIWEELNSCFTQHLRFPHLRAVFINLETTVLPWGTPAEDEDTELLERFYRILSCIQANPHIFHLNGNSSKFFGHVEIEERPSWSQFLRRLIPI